MKNIFENMTVCGSDTKIGQKVIFTGLNGLEYERTNAKQLLTPGAIYTVSSVVVGNDYTDIRLKDVKGAFNSVLFSPCSNMHTKETYTEFKEASVKLSYCKYQDGYEVIMFVKNRTRLWTMTCEDDGFQTLKAQIFG